PCILPNQACQVRDVRNPIVSCVVEPSSGHEWEEDPVDGVAASPSPVLVVGGGVAGLECARVAALRGHPVTVAERRDEIGGVVPRAARGSGRERLALAARWLEDECRRLGVVIEVGREVGVDEVEAFDGRVVLCTGSRAGDRGRSEEHTSELQSHLNLVCRLLLEKKKENTKNENNERQ